MIALTRLHPCEMALRRYLSSLCFLRPALVYLQQDGYPVFASPRHWAESFLVGRGPGIRKSSETDPVEASEYVLICAWKIKERALNH